MRISRRSTSMSAAFWILLLCLFSPLVSSNPNPNRGFPTLSSRSPRRFAEGLIRSLNLIPGVGTTEADDDDTVASAATSDTSRSRLVERKLELSILGDIGFDNASVEELGHHAGYYSLEHTHAAKMFYFFFESREKSCDAPFVLWLTGGPGCSSELALFYENGPFKITDDLSLVWNDYGWDKAANLLYVDQPTGTGFSYSTDLRDIRYDEKGISNDLYDFLQAFFKEHQNFLKNEFYITGESYAGHYIPAITERVHRGNKQKEGLSINLKGFAIGNGLTDPAIQYGAYADYALDMGLINQKDYNKISTILPLCEVGINLCGSSGVLTCFASYVLCNSIFSSIVLIAGDINYYDIRKKCVGTLCYDFSNMEKFLNEKSVRDALGVGNRKFVSCNTVVYEAMITDWMKNYEVGIPALIDDGIKLLIYAGEYDLICNWLGNFRWVNSMEWSGQKEFVDAPLVPFNVDGDEAGELKTYGPLSFLKVHDAGHMVPMDQPKAALEMLKRWIKGNFTEEPRSGVAVI